MWISKQYLFVGQGNFRHSCGSSSNTATEPNANSYTAAESAAHTAANATAAEPFAVVQQRGSRDARKCRL